MHNNNIRMRTLSTFYCLVIVLEIYVGYAIVQKCEVNDQCPINSFCNQNNYCQCKQGFIFDCKTSINPINETEQVYNLNNDEDTLFLVTPSESELIIFYRFNFCQDPTPDGVLYKLALYFDNGASNTIQEKHKIGKLQIKQTRDCWSVLSPYLRFDSQENGITQQMILIVRPVLPKSKTNSLVQLENSQLSTENQPERAQEPTQTIKFKISVDQMSLFNLQTLWAVLISFLCFTLISFIGGIMYCIYWWRRGGRRRRGLVNNLDHFQKFMPVIKLTEKDKNNFVDIEAICSICLVQFAIGDQIRKTPCRHTFHQDCFDQWCKINLTCPECRHGLTKDSIELETSLPSTINESDDGSNSDNTDNKEMKQQKVSEMKQSSYSSSWQTEEPWKQQKQSKLIREKLIE